MKPADQDPAETLLRVRQQLILAQVRIMELEDARIEMEARFADLEKLLRAAQALADQKLDETAHAERVRADCETQFSHLQRVHRTTLESLEAARAQLQDLQSKLEAQLRESAARQQRAEQLEAELRALKSTRSWRWTAWLRALGGKKP